MIYVIIYVPKALEEVILDRFGANDETDPRTVLSKRHAAQVRFELMVGQRLVAGLGSTAASPIEVHDYEWVVLPEESSMALTVVAVAALHEPAIAMPDPQGNSLQGEIQGWGAGFETARVRVILPEPAVASATTRRSS